MPNCFVLYHLPRFPANELPLDNYGIVVSRDITAPRSTPSLAALETFHWLMATYSGAPGSTPHILARIPHHVLLTRTATTTLLNIVRKLGESAKGTRVGDQPTFQRLGIFGGTFDPIHVAHLVIAQEAAARLALDRVLFIPAGQPPHKAAAGISPATDRVAMVQAAIHANPSFALSTCELDHPGPNYTVDTLSRLQLHDAPPDELYLIIGGDMVYDLANWRNPAGIVAQVAGIVAVHRPGFAFTPDRLAELEAQVPGLGAKLRPIAAPQLDISATQIRARVAQGMPVRYLVPDAVVQYIYEHGLYKPPREDSQ